MDHATRGRRTSRRMFSILATFGLVAGMLSVTAGSAAATKAHSATIEVRCTSSGFIADANAYKGQVTEVTAFYKATGVVCQIYNGETGVLRYDPSV